MTETTHKKRGRKSGSRNQFPGLCEAARKLKVSIWHLSKVLNGHRQSRRLTARYAALKTPNSPSANG